MLILQPSPDSADQESVARFYATLFSIYKIEGATLDMFARDGALTVHNYQRYINGKLDLWELDPQHAVALHHFLPREVRIGCAYSALKATQSKYELVVIDSPQGIHHDVYGKEHVEHFTAMEQVGRILEDHALIVLYVNQRPYDRAEAGDHGMDTYAEYDFPHWMLAREQFYRDDPTNVAVEEAIWAYRKVLKRQGFQIKGVVMTPYLSDVPGRDSYAFHLGLEVVKVRTPSKS